MASRGITLRFRTKVGMWRLDDVDPHDSTFLELKARLASERQVDVPSMTISATFGGPPVDDAATPAELRAQNGQILFLDVGEEVIPAQVGRKVAADGQIVAMSHQEMKDKMAFRPGGVAMRDIKKHWTWMDFEEYQKAFEFRVARQKEAHCKGAQLDAALCRDFQSHVERFAYQRCHFAFLYGLFRPDNEIEVLATFEPLQEGSTSGVRLFEDDNVRHADAVAAMLGLERVGIMMSHPPREGKEDFFSPGELLTMARFQGDAVERGLGVVRREAERTVAHVKAPSHAGAGGDAATPRVLTEQQHATLFATVKLTLLEGQGSFEAFQASDQCLEMYRAGALLEAPGRSPDVVGVDSKFDAIVEAKKVAEVHTAYFTVVLPIKLARFQLSHDFPRAARLQRPLSHEDLKGYMALHMPGSGAAFAKGVFDFNLLVYLQADPVLQHMVPDICEFIKSPTPAGIGEGHEVLLRSAVGLE